MKFRVGDELKYYLDKEQGSSRVFLVYQITGHNYFLKNRDTEEDHGLFDKEFIETRFELIKPRTKFYLDI